VKSDSNISIEWRLTPSEGHDGEPEGLGDRSALQRAVDELGDRFAGGFEIRLYSDVRRFDWWADLSTIADQLVPWLQVLSSGRGTSKLEFYEQGSSVTYDLACLGNEADICLTDFLSHQKIAGPFRVSRQEALGAFRAFAEAVAHKLVEVAPDSDAADAASSFLAEVRKA